MSMPDDPIDYAVTTPIKLPRGPGFGAIAAFLFVVVSLGVLGRLVPSPEARGPAAEVVAATPEPAVRLVSPFSQVLYRRTTEVDVRGTAPVGTKEVTVAIFISGEPIGERRFHVDAAARFSGLMPIVPPPTRSSAVLKVGDSASPELVLAEVSFEIEAGSLILVRDPSMLRGTAGSTMLVDVLVYGSFHELRGLLTSVDGRLFASGSMLVGQPPAGASWPRTTALTIEIPFERLPAAGARLHVLGLDRAGTELEHIDFNVALSNA